MSEPSIRPASSEEKKQRHFRRIIFLVLIVLFGLIAISGLNKPFLSPLTTKVDYTAPVDMAYSDTARVVIDRQGQRILILNADNELTALIDTDMYNSPVDGFSRVCIIGDRIYAAGYKRFDQGIYASEEKILSYDLRGNLKETLYSRTYEATDYVSSISILDLSEKDGDLFAITNENSVLSLNRLNRSTGNFELFRQEKVPETVYTAAYFSAQDKILVIGRSKNCYILEEKNQKFRAVNTEEAVAEIFQGLKGSASVLETLQAKENSCYPILTYEQDGKIAGLILFDHGQGQFLETDGSSIRILDQIAYSSGFTIKNLLHWLSLIVLGAAVLAFAIWAVVKIFTSKSRKWLLLVMTVLAVTVFYSALDQKETESAYTQNMITQTQQMGLLLSENWGDRLKAISDSGVTDYCHDLNNQEKINSDQQMLRNLSTANGTSNGLIMQIYLVDGQGKLYTYADSRNQNLSGEQIFLSEDIQNSLTSSGELKAVTTNTGWETYVHDYCYLKDSGGQTIGLLSVGCLRGDLDYHLRNTIVDRFLILTCLLIALYVSKEVIATFIEHFKQMRSRDKNDIDGKALDMSGVFRFFQQCIAGIDGIILVLVAKSLCSGMDSGLQAILTALPLAVFSVGRFLGGLIYNPLKKSMGEKSLMVVSVLGCMVIFGGMVYAITIGSIVVLTIARFILGIFLGGFLFNTTETLPMSAETDEGKKSALSVMLRADLGAGILGQLIGGFLAEFVSYQAIYLAGIGICVPLLILSCLIFKSKKQTESAALSPIDKKRLHRSWSVFLKPELFMYLGFFVLPLMLADGYQSYLFPLISTGSGLSVLLISNLSVFCKASSYVINPCIGKLTADWHFKKLMVVPCWIIAAALFCFLISPNIFWAVIMLFIYDSMRRIPNLPRRVYVIEAAKKYDLDSGMVQANYQTIEAALFSFQAPCLSGFVALGLHLGCVAVGVLNGILNGIWQHYLRKH